MVGTLDLITKPFIGGIGQLASYWWVLAIFGVIIVIAIISYVAKTFVSNKKRWNIQIRIRQENTQNGTIYLDHTIIRGMRVTLSNGLRLIWLEKEILGKRLFPLLNYYTKPGIYDILLTKDNRILTIEGIKGIDEERKLLKIGIRNPGIDYSLEEVNRDHSKLNQLDRKSDLLGIVKAISMGVLAIVLLVAFIIGGKYYLENKTMERDIKESELQLFNSMKQTIISQEEQTNAMILLIDKMKDLLETDNLRTKLNVVTDEG